MNIHLILRNAASSEPDERLLNTTEWTALHRSLREQLERFGTCRLFMTSGFTRTVPEVLILFTANKNTIVTGFSDTDIMVSLMPILKRAGIDTITALTGEHAVWDAYAPLDQ